MQQMPPSSPYRVRYLDGAPAALPAATLACIRFGRALPAHEDPRVIDVDLPALGGAPAVELWESTLPVQHGLQDGFSYAENAQILFGCLRIAESDLAGMDHAAFRAYVRIHRLLESRGYPCWLRVWNYIAHITRGEGDDERYRQFSLGRHRALSVKHDFEFTLPAATAIGSSDGGMVIYFLAGKDPGTQIENPRQISAFRYPREYGLRSPSFTRALLRGWRDRADLLISGTASIVGHSTMHAGDHAAQLAECMNNVRALAQQALAVKSYSLAGEFFPVSYKLYLRDPAQLASLRGYIAEHLHAPTMLLQGDICRRDLLLEVEAHYALDIPP